MQRCKSWKNGKNLSCLACGFVTLFLWQVPTLCRTFYHFSQSICIWWKQFVISSTLPWLVVFLRMVSAEVFIDSLKLFLYIWPPFSFVLVSRYRTRKLEIPGTVGMPLCTILMLNFYLWLSWEITVSCCLESHLASCGPPPPLSNFKANPNHAFCVCILNLWLAWISVTWYTLQDDLLWSIELLRNWMFCKVHIARLNSTPNSKCNP